MRHSTVFARWAPGGDRILYTHFGESGPNLFTMAPDGSDVTQLTFEGGTFGSYSPDGSKIVYTNAVDSFNPGGGLPELDPGIYSTDPVGTNPYAPILTQPHPEQHYYATSSAALRTRTPTVAFSMNRFLFFNVFIGSHAVIDAAAGVNVRTPVIFGGVVSTYSGAKGASSWFTFVRPLRFRTYTVRWEIADLS